ncbi:Cytoplasmic tRNA 2-thiolation protein 2 [Rhodotorula kratochvilovae]
MRCHDHTAELCEIVTTETPFRFTSLALEDVFAPAYSSSSSDPLIAGISASLPLLPSPSDATALTPEERLHALLFPLSPSSRASLLTTLRHALLLAHARATGASILLLGSTGTRLAIDMLSGMASGRGWSAGEEVGAEYVSRAADGREDGNVLVVRPFALVSAREARFLCESEGLRHVDAPQPAEGEKEKEGERSAKGRSIDALVEGAFSHSASARPRGI